MVQNSLEDLLILDKDTQDKVKDDNDDDTSWTVKCEVRTE